MNDTPDNNSLIKDVLARIEKENISPHSRLYFLLREYGIWLFWVLSIVVGAMAVAVSMFILFYRYFDLHEVIRDSLIDYLVEVLPYIWLVLIFLMLVLAVYNIRHTNHGYRYPLWILIVSSLVGSLGGGLVLYTVGFGFFIDSELGTYVDSYDSQDKIERTLWQEPNEGRLFGRLYRLNENEDGNENKINFIDSKGVYWELNLTEVSSDNLQLLQSGQSVRLLGLVTTKGPATFLVCLVLPTRSQHDYQIREMFVEKRTWRERILSKPDFEERDDKLCPKASFMSRMEMKLL